MKFLKVLLPLFVAVAAGMAIGVGFWVMRPPLQTTVQMGENSVVQIEEDSVQGSNDESIAFFYQNVGAFINGSGENQVRVGSSEDGITLSSFDVDALVWKIGPGGNEGYGDPVFSYLDNGRWAMTAWSTPTDPRGASGLMYHESVCPFVEDDEAVVLNASRAQGCVPAQGIAMGKTSQIFSADGDEYIFHAIDASLYLTRLTDAARHARDLEELCVLSAPVDTLDDLSLGESTQVLNGQEEGLRLSDSAIARREDGTWVLFVKGIASTSTCSGGSICELCARSIYRTTSTDLITWSSLEEVVNEASVPEAVTMPDGTVRLYWQDFSDVCDQNNPMLGAIAPISTASELPGTFDLSTKAAVVIPDEPFETNKKLHYATNANPVALPSTEAFNSFEACVE